MEITERDLYNFIFCRSKIPEDKAGYIESSDIFGEELNFFSSLKEKMTDEVPPEIRGKLASAISQYNFTPTVVDNSLEKKTKRKKKSGD